MMKQWKARIYVYMHTGWTNEQLSFALKWGCVHKTHKQGQRLSLIHQNLNWKRDERASLTYFLLAQLVLSHRHEPTCPIDTSLLCHGSMGQQQNTDATHLTQQHETRGTSNTLLHNRPSDQSVNAMPDKQEGNLQMSGFFSSRDIALFVYFLASTEQELITSMGLQAWDHMVFGW